MVHYSDGMEATLTGTNNYFNNSTLAGNTTNGFTALYPDGSQDVFGFIVSNASGGFKYAFLTQQVNANSQATTFNYYPSVPAQFPIVRLESIVDGSGGTNLITYSAAYHLQHKPDYPSDGPLWTLCDYGLRWRRKPDQHH